MLEVDDVVLDQGLRNIDVPDMKLEAPGHRSGHCMLAFGFFGKVHKVSDTLIYV